MNNLKRKLALLLTTILLGSVLFSVPVLAEDQSADSEEQIAEEEEVEVDDSTVRNAYLILILESQLAEKMLEYNEIQDQIEETQDELVEVRESIDTLEDQIDNLDSLIEESEDKIRSVTSQIGEIEVELPQIMEDVEMRELQLEDQKDVAADIMQVLYVKKNIYYEDSDDLSAVKLVLAEGSMSDVMQDMVYLSFFEEASEEIFRALQENKEDLESKKAELEEKNMLLAQLEIELWEENEILNTEMQGKQTLLIETEGHEDVYQELLVISKQEQEQVQDEIDNLQTNLDLLEDKFITSTSILSDEQIEAILSIKAESLLENGVVGASEFLQLDWPVLPYDKGLSAYFVDSSYVSAFGVEHKAIDIPVMQGTAIEAPADGVVYKVQYDEESIGYAYIMLAHRKGVVTVYGHVSAVAVSEGDYVYRDQVIGLTGGVPGTIGAGLRTTGAHLHFEVWQDGILVDPLNYLDLTEIPIDTLREDYLERLQEELAEEIAEIEETLEGIVK